MIPIAVIMLYLQVISWLPKQTLMIPIQVTIQRE